MKHRFFLFLSLVLLPWNIVQAAQDQIAPQGTATVAAAHPEATKAGEEILRAGGSATDAAMAMMLVLTVVEPQSSGIGGGGFLLHHDGASGTIESIDGRETAPLSATQDRFLDDDGKPLGFVAAFPGGKSVGVPGNMRLMEQAHKKWGVLPWARLFDPAIRLADKGYAVTGPQFGAMRRLQRIWANFPEIQAIYWREGEPARPGTVIRNPELAALLRDLAENGADAFYTGDTRTAIQQAVANAPQNPAELSDADFDRYHAVLRPPVCSDYREYRVCGMGPPSSGATTVQQILGLLERFDMAELGPDNMQSWHLIAEAMRLAYADRDHYLGDSDYVGVPVAGLIDKSYLAKRSTNISETRAAGTYTPGLPPGGSARGEATAPDEQGTTHYAAVDGFGNVATMTSTVEGLFGSQMVARGMVLNNELTDFSFAPEKDGAPVPNRVEPGKRPLSSMSPTIVYNAEGQPILTIGSAGGRRIIMHVAKTLIAALDWDMPLDQAMAAPNIYFGGQGIIVEPGTMLAERSAELAKFGHLVVTSNLPSKLAGAERTEDGWRGAVDPRGIGTVANIE